MTESDSPELSQDVFQALMENLEQAIFVKDRERRLTYVNPRFCEFVGHSSEELLGNHDEDFFPPEMVNNYREGDLRVLSEIPEGDYVYIEVSDSGCGMDKATLDRIFDPFYTTKFTGRGLGLAAALGIVRGHKGALKVHSEPERGSTFKLLLPCVDGSRSEQTNQSVPSLVKTRGEGLVLIVDDEENVRATSARMLECAGYTTHIAADGKEGLELFKASADKYRLVLLDLTMPHMDGVETFRELRRARPDIHVVLMSGYNEQEAVERFTGKRLAGFVQKPFQIQTPLGKVKEVLETGDKPPA